MIQNSVIKLDQSELKQMQTIETVVKGHQSASIS